MDHTEAAPASAAAEAQSSRQVHFAPETEKLDDGSFPMHDGTALGNPLTEPPTVSPTPGILLAPVISPAMQELSQHVNSYRIFLDICAGVSRPLSTAVRSLHADVISFDLLLDPQMNLLVDDSYEALLKLCSSGSIAYGAASPSCSQYSRLKLRQDGGPPPLRTPEHLKGVPCRPGPSGTGQSSGELHDALPLPAVFGFSAFLRRSRPPGTTFLGHELA